jgi:outer membrane receptor protein involved in Fe transport
MNKQIILLICACAPAAVWGADMAKNDTTVTQLRDVEIVGVKQSPVSDMDLSTVISSRQVEALDLKAVKGVSEIAPNFYMPSYGSRMTSSIYVRGLGARIDQPVIGLNVDNVPFLNKDAYDFDLVDIDRIEVLRGSRAILNGRNAMAGQVNIITRSPWSYQGLRLSAGYGRANTYNASAAWYGRLSSKLATSVVAYTNGTDGFYRNDFDDSHSGKERQYSARWKMSWHPGSRWSLSNTAAISHVKQDGYPYESLASGKISYNDSTFYKRLSFNDGLTVSYNGIRMIATSITSVQYLDDNMTIDQDFLPLDYFTLTQRRKEWSFTQDIFAKGTRGHYDWLIGVFGFYKPTDMSAPVTFKGTGIARLIEDNVNAQLPTGMILKWNDPTMTLGSDFNQHDGGFAIYHQSTYKLGHWTFRGGLRWDIERVTLDYVSRCNTAATMYRTLPTGAQVPIATREINIDDKGHLGQTFSELLPQLTVGYEVGQWSLFASVSKGYKAGGYNTQMFSDVLQQKLMESMGQSAEYDLEKVLSYKPEKTWNYEFETRYASADKRFEAEGVLFFINCTDQQLTVFPKGQTTGRYMANAGRTHSYGAEITADWRPIDELSFTASYGYTHATFRKYESGNDDYKGKRLPYAPSHTVFASANWTLPFSFSGVTPVLNVSMRGIGDIMWNDANTYKQDFYATLGASLTFNYSLGSVSLWGKNLTNAKYNTFYFQSVGNSFVQRGDPWSAGVTLRANIDL